MSCYINPVPRKNLIIFLNDPDTERIRIRIEWIWYNRLIRVLRNKPKLKKPIQEKMSELENTYSGIRQSPEPPTTGSSSVKH